mmetsp:Transcript_30646/g.88462  ORF Transcript_30646/g.88462 Transcript_30646/m.88462 type:complete len:212 (+) Transcript_30646:443-1078(+)
MPSAHVQGEPHLTQVLGNNTRTPSTSNGKNRPSPTSSQPSPHGTPCTSSPHATPSPTLVSSNLLLARNKIPRPSHFNNRLSAMYVATVSMHFPTNGAARSRHAASLGTARTSTPLMVNGTNSPSLVHSHPSPVSMPVTSSPQIVPAPAHMSSICLVLRCEMPCVGDCKMLLSATYVTDKPSLAAAFVCGANCNINRSSLSMVLRCRDSASA